ncbi:MAG: hypothetical protein RLZZ09_2579 [Pseudomonadota bacterium]
MRTGLSAEQRLQTTYRLLESLQESHDQYYRLVEAISDIVFEHDANGLRFLNPAWTNMLGHGQAASLGRPLLDFVSQPDRELLEHWLRVTREHPAESRKVELRLFREDGVELWAEISGSFSAAHRQHTGIIRDIDAAKIAERALIESERRFRQMADAAPVMIWIAGLDTLCHYFNKTWLDFTGRSLEQEQGNGWAEGVHPEDMDRCLRIYLDAFKKAQSFTMDYRLRRHDGVYRWIQDHGAPQYDEKGQLLGYIGSCIDVTERVQAEELFRGLVEGSPIAMLLVNEDGNIELANEQLAVIFGYAPSELVGQSIELLIPESIRSHHPQKRTEFMRNAQPRTLGGAGNVLGLRRDGQTFPAEIGLSPLTLNGRTHVIAVVVDMTERQRHEQQILDLNRDLEDRVRQRTNALEEAIAAKSKFLAHMSHEIRTPMNAVLGLAQLLEDESLTEDQLQMVHRINSAGRSLLSIINDILDFSKIEAGQLSVEQRPFKLAELLGHIDSLMGLVAQGKGLTLRLEEEAPFAGRLSGDALRIEQVLINLVGNALKFTEQGGVTIRVAPVSVTESAARLRFEIEDTGIGMGPDAVAKLFAPFTQADSGIARRFGGTGLGLSISKRLVELMGGEIGVNSTSGVGSTFWFELPFGRLVDTETPATTAAEVKRLRLQGLRLLVVDDNQINLFLAEKALTKEGAEVILVQDGQQAINYLRTNSSGVDLVLMDIQMPVMDGLAATRAIREELKLETLPVIALTAGVLAEEKQNALDAGVNDFLPKPMDIDLMASMIRSYCSVKA